MDAAGKRKEPPSRAPVTAMGRAGQTVQSTPTDKPHPPRSGPTNREPTKTGKIAAIRPNRLKPARWAASHEQERGPSYCEEPVRSPWNRKARNIIKPRDPAIQRAWANAATGRAFAIALWACGYVLAQDEQWDLVVVDRKGKTRNPARHIKGTKARDLCVHFSDLDFTRLPSVAEARAFQDAEVLGRTGRLRSSPALDPTEWVDPHLPEKIRARRQDRHLQELEELNRAEREAKEQTMAKLEKGASNQVWERALHALRKREEEASSLQRLVRKVTGREQIDRARMAALQAKLANNAWHREEAPQAIQTAYAERRFALQKRQQWEREADETLIAQLEHGLPVAASEPGPAAA